MLETVETNIRKFSMIEYEGGHLKAYSNVPLSAKNDPNYLVFKIFEFEVVFVER